MTMKDPMGREEEMKTPRVRASMIWMSLGMGAALLAMMFQPCDAEESTASAPSRAQAEAIFQRLRGAMMILPRASSNPSASPTRLPVATSHVAGVPVSLSAAPKLLGGSSPAATVRRGSAAVPLPIGLLAKPYAAIGGFAPMSATADRYANYINAIEGIVSVPSFFGDLSSADAIEGGAEAGSGMGTLLDVLGPIGVAAGVLGGYETGGVKGAVFNGLVGGGQYGTVEAMEAAGVDASGPETFGIGLAVGTGIDFGLRMSQCGATWACAQSCGVQAVKDQLQPYVDVGKLVYNADPRGFNAAGQAVAGAAQSSYNAGTQAIESAGNAVGLGAQTDAAVNAVSSVGQAAGNAVASIGSLFGL